MFKKDLDRDEIQAILEEVQHHLRMAIEGLKSVTDGSADRTLIASLEMAVDHEHPWVNGRYDLTVQDLINQADDES